jgi:hypothetical protein
MSHYPQMTQICFIDPQITPITQIFCSVNRKSRDFSGSGEAGVISENLPAMVGENLGAPNVQRHTWQSRAGFEPCVRAAASRARLKPAADEQSCCHALAASRPPSQTAARPKFGFVTAHVLAAKKLRA